MKLYIVEDDPITQRDLKKKLSLLGHSDIHFFLDALSARSAINVEDPDLIIVDIELGKGENGISLGNWLDEKSIPYFYLSGKQDVTTFFRTTQTKAFTNIEKPISLSTLRNTIHSALNSEKGERTTKSFVFLNIGDREVKVLIEEIEYLKADRSYCYIKRKGKSKLDTITLSLRKLLLKLNHPHVCRIHRSYAVNVNHVMERSGNMLYVGDKLEELDLGKKYKSSFENVLNQI